MESTPVVRSDYLINRFHVVFAARGGWHCDCREQAEIRAGLATGRSQFVQSSWRIRARLSR
jgi:hypothetical protein